MIVMDYDYAREDLVWNIDRTEAILVLYGADVRAPKTWPLVITMRATAEEWDDVFRMFDEGDCDGVDRWHADHIVKVEEVEE